MAKKQFHETQLHLFLHYALRYAVGNKSEVVSEYIHAICSSWDCLPEITKPTLMEGLGDQINYHFQILEHKKQTGDTDLRTNLGEPMDADSWIRFHSYLQRQIENDKDKTV